MQNYSPNTNLALAKGEQMIKIMRWLALNINNVNEWIGRLTAWCIIFMVFTIVYNVVTVIGFRISSIAMQELQWHFFALIFLLGAAYTLKHDGHVRIDIFYHNPRISDTYRAWVNLFGHLFLLLPFCALIIYASFPFVDMSYKFHESSPEAGGLPYRFLIKSMIPVSFGLLFLQGIAASLTQILFLLGHPIPTEDADGTL